MNTPIYDAVATDLGWSPEELGPPFDLAYFLRDSTLKAQVHRRLVDAANKESGLPPSLEAIFASQAEKAKVVPMAKPPVKRKGKRP